MTHYATQRDLSNTLPEQTHTVTYSGDVWKCSCKSRGTCPGNPQRAREAGEGHLRAVKP